MAVSVAANVFGDDSTTVRHLKHYTEAEEIMRDNDQHDNLMEERHFGKIEEPTVITTPFIRTHDIEQAVQQLHRLAKLRKLDPQLKSELEKISPAHGEGGFGDHSVRNWDWPLGKRGQVEVKGDKKTFEVWLDFRPYKPHEIWATVMGSELIVHCKTNKNNRQVYRHYTLPLNTDARTAQFRIKNGHTLVVTASKDQPLNIAVAGVTSDWMEKQKVDATNSSAAIHVQHYA